MGWRSTICGGTTEGKTMSGYRRSTGTIEDMVGNGEGGRR